MTDLFRSAFWQLYQHRWSTLTCVICLAVGIGALTSTSSILEGTMLRPLPYAEPDRLVVIRMENKSESRFDEPVSRIDFADWEHECRLMDLAVCWPSRVELPREGGYRRLKGMYVSPGFFKVMQLRPYLGSDFADYEKTGHWQQVMLNAAVWREVFAARPEIVGHIIPINSWASYPRAGSMSFALSGLLPEETRFLPCSGFMIDDRGVGPKHGLDFIMPLNMGRGNFSDRGFRDNSAWGRLKPGASLEEAQAEIELVCARLSEQYPETNEGWTVRLSPLDEYLFADVRPFVVASFVAALLVFVVAIANVVHLLLIQYSRRQSEFAIRSAVGATPWTLFRQVIIEYLAILVGGLLLGLWLGQACTPVLLSAAPKDLGWLPTSPSLSVVLFVVTLSLLAGAFIWRMALHEVLTPNLSSLLGASSRTASADQRSMVMLGWMTQLQLVATYFLILGAGLLWLRTRQLTSVDPGFEMENRLSMVISLPSAKHEWDYNSVFNHDVVRRVRNIPGVHNAAVILGMPMGNSELVGELTIEGRPSMRRCDLPTTYVRVITDDYFETMGIPLLHGRKFNASDSIGEVGWNRTAIVSQSMVDYCWPHVDPIGRRFKPFDGAHWMEVVGVVGDVYGGGVESGPSIEVYYPEKLFPQSMPTLVVHTAAAPLTMVSEIREAILAADADATLSDVRTMRQAVLDSVAERLFGLQLIGAFAVLGCALAAFGVIVTTMHSVACRAGELWIRVACGATPWDIISLVIRQQAKLILFAIGTAIVLGFLVVPSLNLPWSEVRFFRFLAVWIVPLVLGIAALAASLIIVTRQAFATESKI